MTKRRAEPEKRPYELGKRLEQMDESRAAILRAAQAQLAAKGYRRLTMEGLAAETGVTRQTIIAIEQSRYSPSLEMAFQIARVFGVPLDAVFQYPNGAGQW